MLFNPICVPALKFMDTFLTLVVVLGLGTSIIVDAIFSISYPLTYAFPGEISKANNASDGVLPSSVFLLGKNTPLFPSLSSKDSFIKTSKGFT